MDFEYEEADDFGEQILWYRVGAMVIAAIVLILIGRSCAGGSDISQANLDVEVTARASAEDALADRDQTIEQLQTELQSLRTQQANGGDTSTPATGEDGTTAPEPAGPEAAPTDANGNRTYEVQSGDNLSDIAQAVYGDPLAFGIIAEANNLSGSTPLQVGQTLIIPPNPDAGQ